MKEQLFFRIEEIIVDANRLAEVLWLLTGKVRGMSAPQAMVNAARTRNGGVTPVSSGDLIEMFMTWARKRKLTEASASIAREFLTSVGRSPHSANYLFKKLRESGLAQNVGTSPTDSRWKFTAKAVAARKKSARKTAKPKAKG